jgi:guanosine-3',5'-bis(diphosphate) 3'-pyrophosphohydrolase
VTASPDVALVLRAAAFAAWKHRDQRRKGVDAAPYINHPLEVASLLANVGGVTNSATLAAALLHDTVEDTATTPQELVREFGEEIAAIVGEVSDDKDLEKAVRKQLQVDHAAHASEAARLIKLGDKIANLRDIGASAPKGWSLQRRQEYFDWAKLVVDQVRSTNRALEDEFDRAYEGRPQG